MNYQGYSVFPAANATRKRARYVWQIDTLSLVSIDKTVSGAHFSQTVFHDFLIPAPPSRLHLLKTRSVISMTTLRADQADSILKGHLHMGAARRVQSAHPSLYHLRHRRFVADLYDGE